MAWWNKRGFATFESNLVAISAKPASFNDPVDQIWNLYMLADLSYCFRARMAIFTDEVLTFQEK
jgi:hypothetical protein